MFAIEETTEKVGGAISTGCGMIGWAFVVALGCVLVAWVAPKVRKAVVAIKGPPAPPAN